MSTDHVIWRSHAGGKYCVLEGLEGVPKQFQIKRGISRANGWPKDAAFRMDARFPKQVALADSLSNMEDMIVVSARLRDLVAARAPVSLEILPVTILNHKKRSAGVPYFLLNPLAVVDCIDKAASELIWNSINPEMISAAEKLVLDVKAIPAELQLFRMKHMADMVLVRRDLADAISAGGFTGTRFVDLANFPS